ncbi:MAG TPA: hypothetical protein VGC42_03495, partial [Kofleriaceae bacterium]
MFHHISAGAAWCRLEVERERVVGFQVLELGLISASQARARIAEHRHHRAGYVAELEVRTRAGEVLTML